MPPTLPNPPAMPVVGRRRRPRRPLAGLRRRPVAWWTATVALAVATASVVGGGLSRVEADAARYGTTRSVLVATRGIAAGEVVDEANADLATLPKVAVAPGAAGADALGAVATHPVHPGEVVHRDRLAPGGLSPVAALLPAGALGIAVPTGPGALPLAVGDVVEVLATLGDLHPGAAPTVTVATGATVVDVGDDAVTVAIPGDRAPDVVYALSSGLVTLALTAGRPVT